MKRALHLLGFALAVLSLGACGSPPPQDPTATPPVPSPTAAPPTATPAPEFGSRLDLIRQRGRLICLVNGSLAGMSEVVAGEFRGFDADYCRVVAAAIFGELEAGQVEIRAQPNLNQGLEAIRAAAENGDIDGPDLMIRNTTWTAGRDAAGGAGIDTGPVILFDGVGVMLGADRTVDTFFDLEGLRVCYRAGTTAEQVVQSRFTALDIPYEPVPSPNEQIDGPFDNLANDDCDAVVADRSQLAQRLSDPDLAGRFQIPTSLWFSKEPLVPIVGANDSLFRDAVVWSVYATIQAEELQISFADVDALRTSPDPEVRALLGEDGEPGKTTIGEKLGLHPQFGYWIIKQFGNYGDIYGRHLGSVDQDGKNSTDPERRGANKPWNLEGSPGGLLWSPPFLNN